MSVKPQLQRLLFMGKQLEDDYNLFDYSVKVCPMFNTRLSHFSFSAERSHPAVRETALGGAGEQQ